MSSFALGEELPDWAAGVPEDWRIDWLKWAVQLATKRSSDEEREKFPYISNEYITSWTGKLLVEEPKPSEADSWRFQKDDVLFNKLRPYLAKVYHATFDGVSSSELLCLRPSQDVHPRFLFYVIVSKGFIDTINTETFGAKMPRADWEIVGHQPLPLPSLDMQRRIAHFLDEKTARIDGLIEKKSALLDRLAEKRQALITRAVTKGLNPDVPMKPSGIHWLKSIPAHWQALTLRRIARLVSTGRTPPSTAADYYTDGEVSWFTPGDFNSGIDITTSARKITKEAIEEGVCSLFPVGTILLVGIGATLGKVAVSTTECSANQQINAIILDSMNDPYFISYFLHGLRQEVRVASNANTLGILNQDGTKSLIVLVPPRAEQEDIVAILRRHDRLLRGAINEIERSIGLLRDYRSAFITSTVTGQIAEFR